MTSKGFWRSILIQNHNTLKVVGNRIETHTCTHTLNWPCPGYHGIDFFLNDNYESDLCMYSHLSFILLDSWAKKLIPLRRNLPKAVSRWNSSPDQSVPIPRESKSHLYTTKSKFCFFSLYCSLIFFNFCVFLFSIQIFFYQWHNFYLCKYQYTCIFIFFHQW